MGPSVPYIQAWVTFAEKAVKPVNDDDTMISGRRMCVTLAYLSELITKTVFLPLCS